MPTFFEARTHSGIDSMDEADTIAARMNHAARPLGVRILALRRLAGGGVLFASASRRALPAGSLLARLRDGGQIEGLKIGPESRLAPDESTG
jgi:hypothetical protein